MRVEILTIFPEIFESFLAASLIGKAQQRGLLNIKLTQIRDFADAPHFHVDDTPYGGGAGMVMRPEPLARAIEDAKTRLPKALVIVFSASGELLTQRKVEKFASQAELILVCGRYEGVDQRIIDLYVDQQICIGDYVLMGGEAPAMALIEACARLVPGVLGNEESLHNESFGTRADAPPLEAPHYTRPAEFKGLKVPEVLLSGNHADIARWRKERGMEAARERRPDLLK